MSKYIIVLSFEFKDPDDLVVALEQIGPPHIKGFIGTARIAIDPVATQVEEWLDDDSGIKKRDE